MSECKHGFNPYTCAMCEIENAKTRRDRFAMAALTGLLATNRPIGENGVDDEDIPIELRAAARSVKYADALIAELDKP